MLPCFAAAVVAEYIAEVPGQKRETEDPEDGEEGVAVEVQFWGEGAEVVKEASGDEGDEGEEGHGEELRRG